MSNCILYVEDEEADIFLLRHAFKKAGLSAVSLQAVSDGETAIRYLSGAGQYSNRQEYPLPALVLLDLKMPGTSGLDVLAWIRQQPHLCALVVITLSSSANPADVRRAYELGANSFIEKPSGTEQTIRLAQALSNWWLEQNRFAPPTEPRHSLDHAA